jgi:hypothetical protein
MPYKMHQPVNGSIRITDAIETTVAAGSPAAGSITVKEEQFGSFHKTTINLNAARVSVTDTNAYGSLKVLDFPEGRVLVLGATASIRWAVTSARAGTINDNAEMDWSVGSAAASNVTLATTMVDMIPKVDKTLDGAAAAYTTASTGALASSAQFDGTGTALDAYLNVSFPTTTDIDADGTLAADGRIVICWVDLGDL